MYSDENAMPQNHYVKDWNPTEYYKTHSVAESYDGERFSSLSGRIFNWLEKRAIRRALADIPVRSRIADVPCGTGRLAEVALGLGHDVAGIDVSREMLGVAERRLRRFGRRFATEIRDARELEDTGVRFDVVLCARFLMHFPLDEQIEFVKSISRTARQRLIITQGLSTPYQRLRRALKQWLGGFQAPASFPISAKQLKELLAAADFTEIRRYRVLRLLSESVVIVAERTRVEAIED